MFFKSITEAIPSSTTTRVAKAEWPLCLCLCFWLRRAEEEGFKCKIGMILLISNVLCIQTAPKAQRTHPRVINNTAAKFEVNPTSGLGALQGTGRDSLLFYISIYALISTFWINQPLIPIVIAASWCQCQHPVQGIQALSRGVLHCLHFPLFCFGYST